MFNNVSYDIHQYTLYKSLNISLHIASLIPHSQVSVPFSMDDLPPPPEDLLEVTASSPVPFSTPYKVCVCVCLYCVGVYVAVYVSLSWADLLGGGG